jgi:LuxR family maltose regulon positive regulatory protein
MLLTKLHRPPVSKEHVCRDHLIDLLNKNLYKPLTLVSAGAGYGKSMLISSWLEKSNIPFAWFSLDNEDNDLRFFINGLSTSVRKKFPKALVDLNNYLESASLPALTILSESLINGLDQIDKEFVLVIDDYHLIQNMQINELINKLLQFPPQLMHLVIISRSDPFLNLSSLRAHSRINEIRMAELCFNESEIKQLLKNVFQTESSIEISHKLMQQTEGWITGLRLLLLMVKKGEDLNESLEKIHALNPTTTNFLLEEVISNQPESIRNCILKMSILTEFCAELIDELCPPQTENREAEMMGKDVIQILLDANLFTISLDYERKWFRFHHLFQDLLQNQLKKQYSIEEIDSYYITASEWFDKNGFKERAVKKAIKGHKIDLAVDLVSSYRHELLDTGKIYRLNSLIDLLPESIIEETPALLMAKSFIMEYRGLIPECMEFYKKAKAVLSALSLESQETNTIQGEVETIEGELKFLFGDTKSAFECGKKAVNLLPASANYARSYALGTMVLCFQMDNDIESIKNPATEFPPKSNLSITRMQLWYAIAYAMDGKPMMMKKPSLNLIRLGEKHMHLESIMFGKYFISAAHYLSNEDEKARPYLEAVVKEPHLVRPFYLIQCSFLLSVIYIEKNAREKADQLMDFIMRHFEENNDIQSNALVKAIQVELALKNKDLEKALLLNEQVDSYDLMPHLWFVYVPQLTPIKLKLAINTAESVTEGLQMLTEMEEPLRQTNKKAILIDVLILQAVALKKQKKEKDALEKITEALSLSCLGNCIRTYIDYGIELKDLLVELSEINENREHIRMILKAIDEQENKQRKRTPIQQEKVVVPLIDNAVSDTLSFRELEVLELVGQGLRNKEISELLFVQPGTIKQHMKNIFSKLEVHNRVKAVNRAEELNLINKG